MPVDGDAKKALTELLKLIAESPEVADRITITIKPAKLDEDKPRKPEK